MKMPLDRILTMVAVLLFTAATIAFLSSRREIYERKDPLGDVKGKDFSDRIQRIAEKIAAKQRRLFGDRTPTPEEEAEHLTREEIAFQTFLDFCHQGLCRPRDPFPYLGALRPYEDLLRDMGANGCISALANLESSIDLYEQRSTEEERRSFWQSAEKERHLADKLAESCTKFSLLLVHWAEQSPQIGDHPE